MAKRWRIWGPAVAWAVVLFTLSATPLRLGGGWFSAHDKVAHLLIYAVLGAALGHARVAGAGLPHALMLLLGALYGASDEWHQSFVPGRDPSWGDWLADVVGVLLGYTLFLLVAAVLKRDRIDAKGRAT